LITIINTSCKVQQHKQVPGKVTAYVDEGIKKLAELLNTFDKVETFESCQGEDGRLAFVTLTYGESEGVSFGEMASFAQRFVGAFVGVTDASDTEPVGYSVSISMKWEGSKKHPFIVIDMPYNCIRVATKMFSRMKSEFEQHRNNIQA